MATREYYDLLASYYDKATTAPGVWLPNIYLHKKLKKFLKLRPLSALDLGAGTGQTSEIIYKLFPHIPITAVDFSKPMLNILVKKYPDITAVNDDMVTFIRTTKASWPLITAIGSLEFIPRLPDVINHIYRKLLIPGGLLAFTYEPLIDGSSLQNKNKTREQAGATLNNENFVTYRYPPGVMNETIRQLGGIFKLHEDFVSYYKNGQEVKYCLTIVNKPRTS